MLQLQDGWREDPLLSMSPVDATFKGLEPLPPPVWPPFRLKVRAFFFPTANATCEFEESFHARRKTFILHPPQPHEYPRKKFREYFDNFILALVVVNTITIAIDRPDGKHVEWFDIMDSCFTIIFTFEVLVRVISFGFLRQLPPWCTGTPGYFRQGWNVFDFIIVVTGLSDVAITLIDGEGNDSTSVLRVCRVLRPLRTMHRFPQIKILVNSLLSSLPRLRDVTCLYTMFLLCFSIIGVQQYKGLLRYHCVPLTGPNDTVDLSGLIDTMIVCKNIRPDQYSDFWCPGFRMCDHGFVCHESGSSSYNPEGNPSDGYISFDHVGMAFLTLFTCVSLSDWTRVMYMVVDATNPLHSLYFITVVVFGTYFLMNLTVVIVTFAFEQNHNEMIQRVNVGPGTEEDAEQDATVLMMLRDRVSSLLIRESSVDVPWQKYIRDKILESRWFEMVMSSCIILNMVVMACDHYDQPAWLTSFIDNSNLVFTWAFTVELVLHVAGFGSPMWIFQEAFNFFDFVVVMLSWMDMVIETDMSFTVLRATRVLRVMKLAHSFPHLRRWLRIIFHALSSSSILMTFIALYMLMFACLMKELIGANMNDPLGVPLRSNFKTAFRAMLTALQIFSGDDWENLMFSAMRHKGSWISGVFAAYFYIGNFLLLNLFIGILLHSIDLINIEDEDAAAAKDSLAKISKTQAAAGGDEDDDDEEINSEKSDTEMQELGSLGSTQTLGSTLKESKLDMGITLRELQSGVPRHKVTYKKLGRRVKGLGKKLGTFGQSSVQMLGTFGQASARMLETKVKGLGRQLGTFGQSSASSHVAGEPVPLNPFQKVVAQYRALAHEEANIGDSRLNSDLKNEHSGDPRSFFIFDFHNPVRVFSRWLVINHEGLFGTFVTLAIAMSSISLAVDEPRLAPNQKLSWFLRKLDMALTVCFVAESALQSIAFGFSQHAQSYMRQSPWNIFDFVLLILSVATTLMEANEKNSGNLRMLKILRTLRPLRFVRRSVGLRVVLQALYRSLMPLKNIFFFVFGVWFVYAIVGVQLFKGKFVICKQNASIVSRAECSSQNFTWITAPAHFDHVPAAMQTLFQISTLSGWVDVLYQTIDMDTNDQHSRNNHPFLSIYIVSFVILGGFFLTNLFIGALIDAYDHEKGHATKLLSSEQAAWVEAHKRLCVAAPERKNSMIGSPAMKLFAGFVNACIVLNMVTMCMEYYPAPEDYLHALNLINAIFVGVFTIEACVKLKILGIGAYFTSNWNRFDLAVTLVSVLGVFTDFYLTADGPGGGITVLRLLRILRILRMIKSAQSIHSLLKTLVLSLPSFANIASIIGLVFFVFAVIGMNMFGTVHRDEYSYGLNRQTNFDDFVHSFLALMRVVTLDAWANILHDCTFVDQCKTPDQRDCCDDILFSCGSTWGAYLYFDFMILFCTYMLLNLFIAVIMDTFEQVVTLDVPITDAHVRTFYEVWRAHETSHMNIHVDKVIPFLEELGKGTPLGFQANCTSWANQIRFIRSLDPPMDKDKNIRVDKMLGALVRGQLLQNGLLSRRIVKKIAKKERQQFRNKIEKDKWKLEESDFVVSQVVAAWRIQYWYRRWRVTHKAAHKAAHKEDAGVAPVVESGSDTSDGGAVEAEEIEVDEPVVVVRVRLPLSTLVSPTAPLFRASPLRTISRIRDDDLL